MYREILNIFLGERGFNMRIIRSCQQSLIPASHEDPLRPGVLKRVLATRDPPNAAHLGGRSGLHRVGYLSGPEWTDRRDGGRCVSPFAILKQIRLAAEATTHFESYE